MPEYAGEFSGESSLSEISRLNTTKMKNLFRIIIRLDFQSPKRREYHCNIDAKKTGDGAGIRVGGRLIFFEKNDPRALFAPLLLSIFLKKNAVFL